MSCCQAEAAPIRAVQSPQPSCYQRQQPRNAFEELTKGLNAAIDRYYRDAKHGLNRGPYKVAEGVYGSVFEVWRLGLEDHWRIGFQAENQDAKGIVWLFGDPSRLHEVIPQYIHAGINIQLARAGVDDPREVITGVGSTRIPLCLRNGGVLQKEPDGAWVPTAALNSHPTMVLEVAFRNESRDVLAKELRWWSESGVPLSLGIKVDVRQKCDIPLYVLKFLKIDHELGYDKVDEVDFSPGICRRDNSADFIVSIPMEKLMRGNECPLVNLEVDLYKLQQLILKTALKEHIPDDNICVCRMETSEARLLICTSPSCTVVVFHKDCVCPRETEVDESRWLCPYCQAHGT